MNLQSQPSLFSRDPICNLDLNNPYFNSQLITYIGNKRRLLPFLYQGFLKIRELIGKEKLVIFDGFAGSGAASRLLKAFASELYINDLEKYSATLNKAYLANKSDINIDKLKYYIKWLNTHKLDNINPEPGFIEENYAPRNDNDIQAGERVFYTKTNARIIDNIRKMIYEIPDEYKYFCLASLLVKASVHTNTSGVFKGFHKKQGNGHFGGGGEDAISRIKREISLDVPLFSDFECPVFIYNDDINELVKDKKLPYFDLAYYDPPYNHHPYGSNYFMMNIINDGRPIEIQKGVSGISKNWNRSLYNKKKIANEAMSDLIRNTRARYIAISYNNEGIIPISDFRAILSQYGQWEMLEHEYNTYRGSRNLNNRNIKVKELFWILKKQPI
jgi:adenine-specific DNA-methyltransferase